VQRATAATPSLLCLLALALALLSLSLCSAHSSQSSQSLHGVPVQVPVQVHVPERMAAVVQRERLSGPLSLSRLESTPSPGPRELLLRVHYSALNRMDLLQAKGRYVLPPGTSPILGVEVSE
jgi:hypothetical protein